MPMRKATSAEMHMPMATASPCRSGDGFGFVCPSQRAGGCHERCSIACPMAWPYWGHISLKSLELYQVRVGTFTSMTARQTASRYAGCVSTFGSLRRGWTIRSVSLCDWVRPCFSASARPFSMWRGVTVEKTAGSITIEEAG
eukprot:scaffold234667_cov30-Tisochrysis_lutea.AAC.3